jgi:hypothetical protein
VTSYEELVERIGPERYRAACDLAWNGPEGEMWPDDLGDVPGELAGLWEHDDALELGLRLLREMPCYGTASCIKTAYGDLGRAERARLWEAYRAALDSGPERLSAAVEYSLWVDFFEDQSTVTETWREMTRDPTDRRLERLLEAAGPVPWNLKERLFEPLVRDPRWHPFIRAALDASASEYYGKNDAKAAERWRRRISA